jgi:hypothetical protein
MDDNNCRIGWDGIPYLVRGPRSDEDHAQSLRFSNSSFDRYRPAPLMISNTPEYPGYHQELPFSFPRGSPATLLRYQHSYPQVQQQQQIFAIYNPDVTFQQEDPKSRILELEAGYAAYQSQMKEIFQGIINGHLAQAGQSLLEALSWLVGHVEDLGKHLIPLFD